MQRPPSGRPLAQLPSENLSIRPEHVVEFDDDSEKQKPILPNSSPASSRSSHRSASDVKNPTAAKMLSFLTIGSGKRNSSLDSPSARRDEVIATPDIVALAEQRGDSRQASRSSRQKRDHRKERTEKPSYTSVIDIAPTGT
jgi:hypothetical protein